MPSAAILSGGRASRLGGRDKGAMLVGGRTIRERQIAELGGVARDIMIVGGPNEAPPAGVRWIPDRLAGLGPLAGLDAALRAAAEEPVIVLACDMPYVRAALLRALLGWLGDFDAVVPRTERGYHPLCAVYSRRCLPAVTEALAARRLRLIDLLKRIRVRDVAGPDIEAFGPRTELLANINTPADLRGLDALSGHEA